LGFALTLKGIPKNLAFVGVVTNKLILDLCILYAVSTFFTINKSVLSFIFRLLVTTPTVTQNHFLPQPTDTDILSVQALGQI
jgi:hypothetical protein